MALTLATLAVGAHAASAAASIESTVAPGESLSLPEGHGQYFFVGSTAGDQPIGSISWLGSQDLAVSAPGSGYQAISIGHAASHEGSFVSLSSSAAIAGVGLDGYTIVQTFSQQRTKPAHTATHKPEKPIRGASVTLPFTTTDAGQLVLILAGGQATGTLELSGIEATELQNATYRPPASASLASAAAYTAQLPVGKHKAKLRSWTYAPNSGTSVGAVAYVLAPAPAPTVTAVSPATGPEAGGTAVTVTGTDLDGASSVKFGEANASSFKILSPDSIEAVAPPGSGTVDVTVTTERGTSATGPADRFGYIPPPSVTGVSPGSGPQAGGTTVTITGGNFTGASAVRFGSSNAQSFKVSGSGSIEAVSPAGSGTVDVTVTTPYGTSALGSSDRFTFEPPPPPPQSIQIGWSGAHPTWIWMTLTGFPPGTYTYWCDFGSGGDAAFQLTETVSPETWDNGHTCYDTIRGDTVWVTIGSVQSNTIVVP